VALRTTGDSKLLSGPLKGKSATLDPASLPPSLTQLNLLYDLTPPSLITAVCTEVSQPPVVDDGSVEPPSFEQFSFFRHHPQLGFIPPSSVPTVIFKGDAEPL
jgi:hypothetical protein